MSTSPQFSKVSGAQPATERRRTRRRPIVEEQIVPVTFEGDNGGLVLDLAENGLAVQAVAPLQQGKTTEMSFVLPDTRVAIRAVGDVRWAEPSGRAGIRLLAFSKGSSSDIRAALLQAATTAAAPPPVQRATPAPALEADTLRREVLARGLERDSALPYLAERTRELAAASGVAIALGPPQEMMCRASAGAAPAVGVRVQSDSGLSGECVRTGLLVRCDDTETDLRVDAAVCRQLDLRCAVLVPIVEGSNLRGVLEVFSNRPHAFAADDIRRFEQVSALIARLVREPVVSPPTTTASAVPAAEPATPAPAAQPAVADTKPAVADVVKPPVLEDWMVTPAETEPEMVEPAPGPWVRLKLSSPPPVRYVLAGSAVIVLALAGWGIAHYNRSPRPVPVATSVPAAPPPAAVESATASAPQQVVAVTPAKQEPAKQEKQSKPETKAQATLEAHEGLQIRGLPSTGPSTVPESIAPPAIVAAGGMPELTLPAATPAQPRPPASGVVPGRLLHRVNPTYPELARRTRMGGMVVLTAVVRPDGKVGTMRVVSGNPLLSRAAVEAVRQWRYEPFRLNGTAVQAEVTVRLDFNPELRPKP